VSELRINGVKFKSDVVKRARLPTVALLKQCVATQCSITSGFWHCHEKCNHPQRDSLSKYWNYHGTVASWTA